MYGKLTIKLEIRIIPCAVICRPMHCNNLSFFCSGYFNSTFVSRHLGLGLVYYLGVGIAELE